jgi:hypothetical protein
MASLHCNTHNRDYQKLEVNLLSRSLIIFVGTPYRHIQFSKNNWATSDAVEVLTIGIKQHNLLNRSTTVNTISNPRVLLGNGPTKSMVTCWKGLVGFYTGYNNP